MHVFVLPPKSLLYIVDILNMSFQQYRGSLLSWSPSLSLHNQVHPSPILPRTTLRAQSAGIRLRWTPLACRPSQLQSRCVWGPDFFLESSGTISHIITVNKGLLIAWQVVTSLLDLLSISVTVIYQWLSVTLCAVFLFLFFSAPLIIFPHSSLLLRSLSRHHHSSFLAVSSPPRSLFLFYPPYFSVVFFIYFVSLFPSILNTTLSPLLAMKVNISYLDVCLLVNKVINFFMLW